ncbi:MAG: glycosyltransferase family 4 protein [Candidatus Omnitrophota bacterium]
MRISIIATAGKKVSGQTRVLLEYSQHLTRFGHQVTVYRPTIRYSYNQADVRRRINLKFKKALYRLSGPAIRGYRLSWFQPDFPILAIPEVSSRYLPPADFIIFTSPALIPQIPQFPEDRGKPFFMVQSGFFAENPTPVPLEISLIAIASRLQKHLSRKFPERKVHLLVNGINLKQFSNPDKIFKPAEVVGMVFYQKRPAHKGLEDGIQAFETVKKNYPHLNLRMVGERRERWLPSYVEFWDGNNQENVVKFYRSLDVFLYPSRLDACPLPPMEALACKCGLVTTDVSGISDFTVPGETALVSPAGAPDALTRNLAYLAGAPDQLRRLSLAGYEKIKEFSYENQAKKLEEILRGCSTP